MKRFCYIAFTLSSKLFPNFFLRRSFWDHSFSMFAKFSKKLNFLTPPDDSVKSTKFWWKNRFLVLKRRVLSLHTRELSLSKRKISKYQYPIPNKCSKFQSSFKVYRTCSIFDVFLSTKPKFSHSNSTPTAQKMKFSIKDFSSTPVNVTKSTGNCGFGLIYWRNP